MIRVNVDYNERDREGRVFGRLADDVPVGTPVELWDPVDRLAAKATVAVNDPGRRRAAFDVDWESFEDR